MTSRLDIPFNLTLLEFTPAKLQHLKPVTVLDSFDGTGTNFHESGLFSTSTFGRVGDDIRYRKFSYIDIKVSILHPVIFRALGDLKQLYQGILAGTDYAVFNEQEQDFVRADTITGKTGYQFFISNWKKIRFMETKSVQRDHNIQLILKYSAASMTSKIAVIPAGFRDMEIGNDGRPQEDEINTFYRKLLAIANTVSNASIQQNPEVINNTRYNLQRTFNQIYTTLEDMIQGRRKLIQNRWTARRLFNGTRNVITATNAAVPFLGAPGAFKFNDTVVGLYQTLKMVLPVSKYLVRAGFISKVFIAVDQPAKLVNKKTLKSEPVTLKTREMDRWMTDEGMEKIITSFAHEDVRHRYLELSDHYLGLIYKGPDGTFKIFQDIDELPEGRDKKDVTPLTFCELLYCSTFSELNKYPTFVTRYPVTGMGSIYPSQIFVKTTIKSETRRELDEQWQPMAETHTAHQFPIRGSGFINSLSPHPSKLQKLSADHDGDTCSSDATYSVESMEEVRDFLNSVKAYVDTSGRIMNSTNVDTVMLALYNLTGA